MQSPRLISPEFDQKRKARAPDKPEPEPFSSLQREVASELSASAVRLMSIVESRPFDMGAFNSEKERYVTALDRLAGLRPETERWMLERMALPDSIRNLRLALYDLPETPIPFSPSSSWTNPRVEEALRGIPTDERTLYTKLIAHILDRYVQTDFPAADISQFYRNAVALLREAGGRDYGGYHGDLVAHSRFLAEKGLTLFYAENPNLLNMSLHKTICIETGVPLAERDSAHPRISSFRFRRRPRLRHGGPSMLDEFGVTVSPTSIARSIAGQWKLGVFDSVPAFNPVRGPSPATGEQLLEVMSVVLRSGMETMYEHPALRGFEFTQSECSTAASIAVEAERLLRQPEGIGTLLPADNERAVLAVQDEPRFSAACKEGDRAVQMQVALGAYAIELRAAAIGSGDDESYAQASEDVSKAMVMAEEYLLSLSAGPDNMTLKGVRRMLEMGREAENADATPAELAFMAIDEMRSSRLSLVTMRPPAPELMPPPAEQPAAAPAAPAAPAEGRPQEAFAEERPTTPDMRSEEIPELTFPHGNTVIDTNLEHYLPPKTDERTALVRQVARNLRLMMLGTPGETVAAAYQSAVEELRASFTYEKLVELSAWMADRELARRSRPSPAAGEAQAPSKPPPADAPAAAPAAAPRTEDMAPPLPLPQEQQAPAAGDEAAAPAPAARHEAAGPLREAVAAPVPQEAPPEEATLPGIRPVAVVLGELLLHEKELVAAVMRRGCDEEALSDFLRMHPGARELQMRNFISTRWTRPTWRNDIPLYEEALQSLYGKCGMQRPTPEEMFEAAHDPGSLTPYQREAVGSLFGVPENEVDAQDIEAFHIWVSSDPMTPEGSRALRDYWQSNFDTLAVTRLAQKAVIPGSRFSEREMAMLNRIYGKGPGEKVTRDDLRDVKRIIDHAKSLERRRGMWFDTVREERLGHWRGNRADLLSAADLLHNIRFNPAPRYSEAEKSLLSTLCNQDVEDPAQLGPELQGFISRLTSHTVVRHIPNPKAAFDPEAPKQVKAHFYSPEIMGLASLGPAVSHSALRSAAMRHSEYSTMLEALGVRRTSAKGAVYYSDGQSKPKRKNGGYEPNDDSFSSVRVAVSDGTQIILDMVADGMGGHTEGWKEGMPTNGQIASGVAKEIFEIAAVAGWIREPEDVRRFMLAADLAIVMEQVFRKENRDDWRQENNMGTTMTVGFQRGHDFWTIHCGDSDAKVFRGGAVAFHTEGHSSEYATRLAKKAQARDETAVYWRGRGVDVENMDPSWAPEFERQAEQRYEELMAPIIPQLRKNEVCSVLGVMPNFIHINNANQDPGPFPLRGGDLVAVHSDGIEAICDHEFRIFIEGAGGDLKAAAAEMIFAAEGRRGVGPHQTLCECKMRQGKRDDDKTIVLRAAEAGFSEEERRKVSPADWLKKSIWADPRGFASSVPFRKILESCLDPAIARPAVLEIFDGFISAAEEAPQPVSRDAFTVSTMAMFYIAAGRPDRDELLRELVPKIDGWSGFVMKKLRNSPNASPQKMAMLDFLSMCIPPAELKTLAGARNHEIRSLALERAGSDASASGNTMMQSEAWPPSIFHSQTDVQGNRLDAASTRYLDSIVLEINDSTVVQDTARSLKVLPRDLEVMAFYVYSGFDPKTALDPHTSLSGDSLISEISYHLSTGDAASILTASYLIYLLRESRPQPEQGRDMVRALWGQVDSMNKEMQYSLTFFNEAVRLKAEWGLNDVKG